MQVETRHTQHSKIRSQQRGVCQQMIDDTIYYGELIRKQGLRYYIMTERSTCFIQQKQYKDRLKNTVVILTSDNTILTVYKNARAIRNVKKKPKRLAKYFA